LREAFAAQYGPALRGAKGDGGLLTALRAGGASFDATVMHGAWRWRSCENGHALGLAHLTALGFVLEPFVVEEQLFPGGKDEIDTAVDAGQYLVLKFH